MGKVLKALPFDAQQTIDPLTGKLGYDRTSNAKDLAAWMGEYFGNGVIVKGGNVLGTELEVTAATGLNISVAIGEAVINGRTCWNELATEIAVDVGDTSDRIDRIVLSLDTTKEVRTIEIKVLKGTPNGAPVAPTLTRTTDIYQLSLAQVRVNASQAVIASVTDERPDATVCGMSNVLIGIKPPTGMDAVTVQLGAENVLNYGAANVDEAFGKALDLSSYQAFCASVNATSLDAAFGKNNVNKVFRLGLQLAMYAWFKGTSSASLFTNLIKYDTLSEIESDATALEELYADTHLNSLISSNPYANGILMTESKIISVMNLMTSATQTTLADFWVTNKCMSDMYKARARVIAARIMDFAIVRTSVGAAPNRVEGSRGVAYNVASTQYIGACFVIHTQFGGWTNFIGWTPEDQNILDYDWAKSIIKHNTGGSSSSYTFSWNYIPITLVD